MGYKLAGFRVLGGVELDPAMLAIYRANHKPEERFSFGMGVQEFKTLPAGQLPEELFDLDILDGSPPCSVFSMAGKRSKKWGVEARFREGQAVQRLDDLFFDFIDVAALLQPRAVIAENVKGMVLGNARGFVKEIFREFRQAGYRPQLFLLNSAAMGVPQKRERTFFVAVREDLAGDPLTLDFAERAVPVKEAWRTLGPQEAGAVPKGARIFWEQARPGESLSKYHPKGSYFNLSKCAWDRPACTVVGGAKGKLFHPFEPRTISGAEVVRLQAFPDDYDFGGEVPHYVCGMSVPPYMTQRVALEVARQVFGVDYDRQPAAFAEVMGVEA